MTKDKLISQSDNGSFYLSLKNIFSLIFFKKLFENLIKKIKVHSNLNFYKLKEYF
jgi:hypothetical protein